MFSQANIRNFVICNILKNYKKMMLTIYRRNTINYTIYRNIKFNSLFFLKSYLLVICATTYYKKTAKYN